MTHAAKGAAATDALFAALGSKDSLRLANKRSTATRFSAFILAASKDL